MARHSFNNVQTINASREDAADKPAPSSWETTLGCCCSKISPAGDAQW